MCTSTYTAPHTDGSWRHVATNECYAISWLLAFEQGFASSGGDIRVTNVPHLL
jgi:hypothetical protein